MEGPYWLFRHTSIEHDQSTTELLLCETRANSHLKPAHERNRGVCSRQQERLVMKRRREERQAESRGRSIWQSDKGHFSGQDSSRVISLLKGPSTQSEPILVIIFRRLGRHAQHGVPRNQAPPSQRQPTDFFCQSMGRTSAHWHLLSTFSRSMEWFRPCKFEAILKALRIATWSLQADTRTNGDVVCFPRGRHLNRAPRCLWLSAVSASS